MGRKRVRRGRRREHPYAWGDARVTASDGKVELRLNRDFLAVPRVRLQQGIEAFLATLDEEE